MSRRNNVRGPTSALTEFLRESGITPTTVARRVRTREVQQPQAGPSNEEQNTERENGNTEQGDENYASDHLDDSETEEMPLAKKRKLTKAAQEKLKAKEKEKAKKKAKAKDDDDDDEDEDAYTALSKMRWESKKPPIGNFEKCAKCSKQFTVTKYTMASGDGPGFLCHICAKASGNDPFKKPAAPKRRKATEKRNVTHFEERRIPSLASSCVQVISHHIDDVEALGNIGSVNLDMIAKAIARDRSLTPQNAMLFYDVQNSNLTLYDVTNLDPPALCTLATLNPNLTNLRLDFCGRIDNTVLTAWSTALPNLKRIELLGPFLVYSSAWQMFFKSHPDLEGFLITQSPRFDLKCMESMVANCKNLRELRLKEIGKMDDKLLKQLEAYGNQLTYLEISYPGIPEAISQQALIDLMSAVCGNLNYLNLSGNLRLTDEFLHQGLKPFARHLQSLALVGIPDLTDAGVAEFFNTWKDAVLETSDEPNPSLISLDLSRNHTLAGDALQSILAHSGQQLESLNINGWNSVPLEILMMVTRKAPKLRKLDIGWCREVDNWVVQSALEGCSQLDELKVWGCQRLTNDCPRKRRVALQGIQAHQIASI